MAAEAFALSLNPGRKYQFGPDYLLLRIHKEEDYSQNGRTLRRLKNRPQALMTAQWLIGSIQAWLSGSIFWKTRHSIWGLTTGNIKLSIASCDELSCALNCHDEIFKVLIGPKKNIVVDRAAESARLIREWFQRPALEWVWHLLNTSFSSLSQ